ncbi:FMRFamide-related peptides type HF-4 [Harmonia axyridis]|uniref:FMRFamide-related peptides type HF-4 n=1 Tax=Harmonia axyridis TaxID=115357 RepID=UPI001E275665|nr:FMRFamide-related peptides type HF-4 [Harmonia axyridis]
MGALAPPLQALCGRLQRIKSYPDKSYPETLVDQRCSVFCTISRYRVCEPSRDSPMYISGLLVLVLTQYTWAYNDDNYPFSDNYDPNIIPFEDYTDQEDIFEPAEKRSENLGRYEQRRSSNDPDPRPTRGAKMLRSDYFVRFGRSKQDFLRFGRDPPHQRLSRSRDYLRFGRSLPTPGEHERSKREATFEPDTKRNSNFLRFGRNSNFLRFGRTKEDHSQHLELTQEDLKLLSQLRRFYESPLSRLFAQLEFQGQRRCESDV